MTAFVAAGLGFLLAVLWFDLMYDVQAMRHRSDADLPEPVLASISGYYGRVTTGARPMNRLIARVMVATIAALVVQLAGDDAPDWVGAHRSYSRSSPSGSRARTPCPEHGAWAPATTTSRFRLGWPARFCATT